MRCPYCEAEKESLKVIDSRSCDGGKAIRRRRECKCGKRFTTYEKVEQHVRLIVVKKDGRRVPWDPKKIYAGLERACFKRPVPEQDLQRITDEVEEEIFKSFDREVPSKVVGELVTDRLRRIDQVAYVRFASVYRQFRTLEELVDEANAVIHARRMEDPRQGHLFVDPKPGAGDNGHALHADDSEAPAKPGKPARGGRGAHPRPTPGDTVADEAISSQA
jgi:transcriptional repressor NrdR